MRKKNLLQIGLWVVLLFFASNAYAVRLKIATLSPEGSMWMEKMREGAKKVAKETENRVKIKFYPGGVMGDDKAVLRKMRIGQLQGGAFVAGSLSNSYPDCQIYALPLKFSSFEEVDYVRERMDGLIMDGLEEKGFVVFGMAEGGFAHILSKMPVRTIAELRRQKVWIPDNDRSVLESVKAFELPSIPLSIADVRAGLQTGLIDTVTTPPIGAVILQWHTQVKYLMDLPFVYIYAIFAVDKKAFSKIGEKDRKKVREILGSSFKEIDRQNRKDHEKALEALQKQGIQFIKPPPEAMGEWIEKAGIVSKKLIESGELSPGMIQILEKHLADYRSKTDG